MSSSAPQQTPGAIQGLLQRMTSADKDFRFMATNDLIGELQRDNRVRWDDDSETKVANQVIGLLRDSNGEVQNLAVKCLGFLVCKIKDDRKQLVVRSLCQMLKNEVEQVRDITSIALKTIVSELPATTRVVEIVTHDLLPDLLTAISDRADINVQLESLDILTEIIHRMGAQLSAHHASMQAELVEQLNSDRSAVRKKSMNALANLLSCCTEDLFNNTINHLFLSLTQLAPSALAASKAANEQDFNSPLCTTAKTLLQCLASIIRAAGHRSNLEQLNQIMPVIHTFSQIKDDELREYCLQTFEIYVRRCPVEVSSSLPAIIKVCLTNITHDPNYNYNGDHNDLDDETMDTGSMDEDEPDSESADDYSDDDDLSWKVRRASAKCIEAVILARRDLINDFFVSVAPVLIARFKEREDSVKADIVQTFVSLLKQTRALATETKYANQSSLAILKLNEMIPTIAGKSSNLLREKGIRTRQLVFQMLTEVMNIIPDALSDHISYLIPCVLYSLTDKNSTSNMKIDALLFIQELIKTHKPDTFYPHINTILSSVVNSVGDSFYKISSEALALLSQLICVIRPPNCEPMPNYEPILTTIYQKTLEKMSRTDIDLEIKEKAIICMGHIVSTFGDKMASELSVALNVLNDKLNNETTRLTCVKALIKIANSPVNMSLNHIFPKAYTNLASFLRKNSRPLRVNTLILIENIVRRSSDLLDSDSAQSIVLADIANLIKESDLYVSQLALTMLTTIIRTGKTSHPIIIQQILPEALKLIQSPLLQASALQAMLHFLSILEEGFFPGLDYNTLLKKLAEPIYNGKLIHKQGYNSTAKAIATIAIKQQARAISTVNQLIQDSEIHQANIKVNTLILLCLGEIGKVTDLGEVPKLVEVILKAFESSSEDVKTAGSYALGCVAVGNLSKFLPIILHEIETRNKRQYLILHSLREVISAGQLEQLELVWGLLMKHCECQEEGTRNVVSECLGKLTLLKPDVLLARLIHHLEQDYKDKPLARSTLVAAVKFTISDQPQEIDPLLRQCIGKFLQSLQDTDLNVRRVALITFNSIAHNKPSLITDLLPDLLPLLYNETLIKPELVREVKMGPFKHQVDDGLDSRKAAFECMYTLLDTCQNQLDIFEFLTYVENGLRDHYDIKLLTYLMLTRLATLCPAAVLQRLEGLIHPIQDVCQTVPKENAVKQEHEKHDELKRAALRAFDYLRSIPNASRHPFLVRFNEEVVQGDKDLLELYSTIHRDSIGPGDHKDKMATNSS